MQLVSEDFAQGATLVKLAGRLDIAGAGASDLDFNALAGGKRALIVDLAEVQFVASLGIRLLVIAGKTVAAKGGRMALLSPSADVESVLTTAGIDQLIPICRALPEAIAAVTG